jgi:hypothetical protein
VVCGKVQIGVGHDDGVVLCTAKGLNALSAPAYALVNVTRDRRRSHERDRRDVGMIEHRVDGDLIAMHDVEHAVRQAASAYRLATKLDADGSRSDGLSTSVLPLPIATGCESARHTRLPIRNQLCQPLRSSHQQL